MCMVIEKLARQSRGGKEFTIPFHIFKNIYILCLKMVLEVTSSQLVLFIT